MNSGRCSYCIKKQQRSYKRICEQLCVIFVVCCLLLCCVACNPFSTAQSTPTSVLQQPPGKLTYVAIGASDTFGIGADDPQTQSWPADLSTLLGRQVHLINLGVPNIDVHNALGVELPIALDAHPDIVTIWLAVNDLADNVPVTSYSHDLDLLLTRLRAALPHVRLVVANVPDLTLLPHFNSYDMQTLRTQILTYNNAIASIVARHSALLVNLYQSDLAQHPEYISDDGFHPSTIGYTQVAQLFYQILKSKS
jgi:lysophospholipase L1-like esterase